ncbi:MULTISPECIES: ABC transporter ATP-binding protein [Pseudoxanthomonas]|jgi:NitT/TauT family transport system ATP-binding protein|uniref:ABC transporter ATP-binding protein n=1 Tax=Pseudoxanthomonas winnipegensis TaxID=2480810 RepID=A0A4V2KK70_9GAMM|nr:MULTISPECIES: ABC transporter ATP-binding protein [Pseudoxanthomonas]RZZ85423.1 ABC transporter ATP-binding protein [Pseudoxanthomonas winnipegensis]RZZ89194.1 ABC transporter ATP-binding protein [Pseudoxanthomonas winnipegensis]TAA10597.1 ABC transporter ATP-binding protein [Pseudoxanthomonas winnipegensis]TAA22245.1 ABC transporter ATP-binding protein [Pseudoxanthomonas winnipegensis]TAA33356.1 ABC transporter ATP-binding protein [Pseudoxanthomonas winnipegensis]
MALNASVRSLNGAPQFHPAETMVAIDKVTMSFGDFTAVREVDLQVGNGEFVAIVGPTGCGKSTVLNAVAGLLTPASGGITIDGVPVKGVQKSVGYLFQQDALLPWKTALQNVELGLRFRGMAAKEREERARAWLAKVGLSGFEHRYPHQLSGGQRKRVQMAQALIVEPKVILMDEPFSALDIHTRHLMQNELLRLWQEDRRSVVLITHDLEEAIALGDRVVVLSAGPASRVVRSFDVDLERPRNVAEIKLDQRFTDLYRDIWACLRGEVEKSYARQD